MLKHAAGSRFVSNPLTHHARYSRSTNQSGSESTSESKPASRHGSARLVLLAAAMLAMCVLLCTASVSGSGRSGQQSYIPPVPTSIPQVSAREFGASTRSAVELPSKRYRVAVEKQAPVNELGALEPARLLNLRANQIGVDRQITQDLDGGAKEVANADGTALRLFSIKSTGAQAIRVHFRGFDLPEGDQVFVYGASAESHVGGPYSRKGPFENGDFWADVVEGDTIFVEHFVAAGGAGSRLSIPEISHAFAGFDVADFAPQLLSCHVDASCGEFAEKNAIARILFQDGGLFVCTGTLVNNRAQDHTPLFLTAAHCVSNGTVAQTVQAFWFYQTTACNSGILRLTSSQSGTSMLVTDRDTDSTLLRFNNAPPPGVVFVGWDPNPRFAQTAGFALHHPAGGTPPSLTSFLRSADGTIVNDNFPCAASGLVSGFIVSWTTGDTEQGSSGSALFASDGAGIIGVLSCGPVPASCSNRISLYSKFADFYSRAASPFLEGGATPCVTSLAPPSRSFSATGGTGTVNVTTSSSCAWTATTNANWITITSGSGTGNGQISYTVIANPFTAPRSGTITADGQTHTVNQAGVNCSFEVSPGSRSFGAGGGTADIGVTTGAACGWSAIPSDAWITINAGAQGNGNGTVNYTVAANTSPSQRTGQISIEGQIHTITQSGIDCNFSLAPATAIFQQTGGNGTVNVTVISGCGWTAGSNATWLVITAGGSGNGNGVVSYSVAANSAAGTRTGRITVSDKFIDVTQSSGPFINTIVPEAKNLIILGVNFDSGAKVFMDGVKQKTLRDTAAGSTRLVAKKAFKKIGNGQTVSIVVKNSDGSESPAVPFFKPGAAIVIDQPRRDRPRGHFESDRNRRIPAARR
jgi:hypothetical protein